MAHPIDGGLASAAQQALAQHRSGNSAEACVQYQAIFGEISARYTQEEMSANASIACILADFARACAVLARVAEADSLYASAYRILVATAGEAHPVTLRCVLLGALQFALK